MGGLLDGGLHVASGLSRLSYPSDSCSSACSVAFIFRVNFSCSDNKETRFRGYLAKFIAKLRLTILQTQHNKMLL